MLNTDPSSIESLSQDYQKILHFSYQQNRMNPKKKVKNTKCRTATGLGIYVFIFIFYLPVWNTSYQMCCFGPFLEKKPKNVIIIILS